jgi:hypothetical protein
MGNIAEPTRKSNKPGETAIVPAADHLFVGKDLY